MNWVFWKKWFSRPAPPPAVATPPPALQSLFDAPRIEENRVSGLFLGRAAVLVWEPEGPGSAPIFQLACQSDLWCRPMRSVTTMLDPSLFESYTTGVDRIDEDWIVQSNPPFAFRNDQKEGCDALFRLLQNDAALHATHGWLLFRPGERTVWTAPEIADYFQTMSTVVKTAERELKSIAT